jgi:hypothetical protein
MIHPEKGDAEQSISMRLKMTTEFNWIPSGGEYTNLIFDLQRKFCNGQNSTACSPALDNSS